MKQVISKLETGVKSLFGYVGIIMILIETYAVFARNVLKTAAPWTDETLKLLFVWSIFICSGLHDPVAIETTYPTMQLFSELDIPFTKRMYPGNHMWHPWRQGLYHFLTNLLW